MTLRPRDWDPVPVPVVCELRSTPGSIRGVYSSKFDLKFLHHVTQQQENSNRIFELMMDKNVVKT